MTTECHRSRCIFLLAQSSAAWSVPVHNLNRAQRCISRTGSLCHALGRRTPEPLQRAVERGTRPITQFRAGHVPQVDFMANALSMQRIPAK